jgi:hypothetical protein
MTRRSLHGALLVAVMSLAACGGDGTTDRDAITKIITDGGRDPATICDHLSAGLLQRFRSRENCRRAARSTPANQDPHVRIRHLSVTGDRARAAVTGSDGRTTITFTKDHGSWKVTDTR